MITLRHVSVIAAAAGLVALGVAAWRGMMKLMDSDEVYGSGLDWVRPGPASGLE
jgi:hypothetical protein